MSQLKLIAMDEDDLAVVAAHVQDAITKPTMLEYSPSKKQFSIMLNRFDWAGAKEKDRKSFTRRGTALVFAGITSVRTRGIRRGDENQALSLLTIQFNPETAPGGIVDLVFAKEAAVQLVAEYVEVRLDDLGSVWETKFKPRHPLV